MKKFLLSFFTLLLIQQLSALSFYDQLCNFNFNWKKYFMRAPAGDARVFHSDQEYIQAHLGCVLEILRHNPTEQLSPEQLQSRRRLIALLDGYRSAGNFPMNYYRKERTPVFIDEHNTHCAVGYLLQQTGHEDIARRIAAAGNYVWVKDIHDPEVIAWQQQSGLTLEELKLIQGAYDSYMPNALFLPNKYEVPQKPDCIVEYFKNPLTNAPLQKKPENIWIQGEGKDGVLNGRWVQNYALGFPWIVGYYVNGKRSGQWMEYYQGTKKLCRTENWRNDKLNGIRKRWDREGRLIEEIVFKDGKAVKKTNYSLEDSLTWIRVPIDSEMVATEVYSATGALIASGHEKVYNPGNLQWFQNIELTALNTISVQARDLNTSGGQYYPSIRGAYLYSSPPLVQYFKEKDWTYYREQNLAYNKLNRSLRAAFPIEFRHFGAEILNKMSNFDDIALTTGYDSVQVKYLDDMLCDFYGYGSSDFVHFQVHYYKVDLLPYYQRSFSYRGPATTYILKDCGFRDRTNSRTGEWKYFSTDGTVYKTENYLVAWKEEED